MPGQTAVRGFVPPQTEAERFLVRRVEELCRTAGARGISRYTGFLSDREQSLAQAAMNRVGCTFGCFDGGWEQAERRVLCLEPPEARRQPPIALLCIQSSPGFSAPGHRDYLGALLGLGLERVCIGDILPDPADEHAAYVFVLEDKAEFITANITEAGRSPVRAQRCAELPPSVRRGPQRVLQQATVPSLRADAVLAAMLHTSRTLAAQAIQSGRVEVNHLPLCAPHAQVVENDLFTVRGAGRCRLAAVGGTSRKNRIFITFYQY